MYGKKTVCRCGYHDPLPPPSKPGSAGSSVAAVEESHTRQCAVQPPPSSTMSQATLPPTSSSMPSSSPHPSPFPSSSPFLSIYYLPPSFPSFLFLPSSFPHFSIIPSCPLPSPSSCFLSAGSPASFPSKSRVVEAICIKLSDKFPKPCRTDVRGRRSYTSRWRLVLSEYNNIRARLLNSQALLEGTNLVLFTINEATLVRWHKNSTRVSEIRTLMQGIPSSLPPPCAPDPLPPARELLTSAPLPKNPLRFPEPEDTTGQAELRRVGPVRHVLAVPIAALVPSSTTSEAGTSIATTSTLVQNPFLCSDRTEVPAPGVRQVPKTTQWRHKQKGVQSGQRRVYSCRVCSQSLLAVNHYGGPCPVLWADTQRRVAGHQEAGKGSCKSRRSIKEQQLEWLIKD